MSSNDNKEVEQNPRYMQLQRIAQPRMTKMERVGRGVWLMLHMLSEKFEDKPLLFLEILQETIEKVIPCDICKADTVEHLLKYPITSTTNVALWMCTFHNKVNLKTRKQVFPCEPYMKNNRTLTRDCVEVDANIYDGFVDMGYYLE